MSRKRLFLPSKTIVFALALSAPKLLRVRFVVIRPCLCFQAGKYPLKLRPNHAVNSDVPVNVFVLVGIPGGAPVTWFR